MKQLTTQKQNYSTNAILNAFFIFSYSSSVYNIIRDNNILILPHESTLKKISAYQNISVNDDLSNFKYLTMICNKLNEQEKIVNIQIDEMYAKKQVTYSGKNVYGFDENSAEVGKTILGFMINSVYGHMKEIVSLIPVSKVDGEKLQIYTKNIIKKMQSIGFKVLCITTDNHKINRKCFGLFKPNSTHFENPDFPGEKIFMCFDTVHLKKNIYNNWVNRKDFDKSFCIPNFENTNIQFARFNNLREIHKADAGSVLKKAYKLNMMTLYPSSLDKQKVSLSSNVFHESTSAALVSAKNLNYEGIYFFS